MKKLFLILSALALLSSCADLSEYEKDIDDLKVQVESLGQECARINARIEALQALVAQVQAREMITGISEVLDDDGNVTGYVLTFKNSDTIAFDFSGNDNGQTDAAVISVKEDSDGLWWTLNGEFMLDEQGNRLPARRDGVTPQLKVEDGSWLVSVDGGKTWNGMSASGSVQAAGVADVVKGEDEVTLVLTDGSTLAVPLSKVATLSLSYSENIVPGASARITYKFSSSTGVANVSVFGNKYIGAVSVTHRPQYGDGFIYVNINENYDVSLQKLFVYLDYGDGVLTKVLTFKEKGVFEIDAIAPLPASGGDFDVNVDMSGYSYLYTEVTEGGSWLSGNGSTFTASANSDYFARTGAIKFEVRNQYGTTLFSKTVYVVQYGTGSFSSYQEYVGTWKMSGNERLGGGTFSRTVEVKRDQEVTDGYLIYGLSPSAGVEHAVRARYDSSSGNMVLTVPQKELDGSDVGLYPVVVSGGTPVVSTAPGTFTFTSNSSLNTMTSSMDYYNSFMFMSDEGSGPSPAAADRVFYYNVRFERMGVAEYYDDGDVVMLNNAAAGYTPLNLVILGDGYQQKDLRSGGKFEKSARSAMNSFFAIEPFKSFKDRFDVYMIPYASVDEGTDVTSSGIYKDTYYSSVCTGGGNTLVTCDYSKVLSVVGSCAGLTEANYGLYRTVIILLVNTTEQSGTCWYSKQGKIGTGLVGDGVKSYAIAMLAADTMGASGLVKHEAGGHAFGRLADEYNWGGTADAAKKQSLLNEQNNNGYYFNVTATTGSDSPWAEFVGRSGYEDVGYYEGGWGCSTGIYRPTQSSIMLNNQGNFNAPSRLQIYKRIILQSEGAGAYSFEKFLEYDKRNLQ